MSEKNPETSSGELIIGTSAERILVRIQKDGTIIYGPEYTPDEAAKVLWSALARQMQSHQEREVLTTHVQQLLGRLGHQDLRYEACQLAAMGPEASPHDKFQEERARNQLEMLFHQIVELARGLALRDQADSRNKDAN